jgi:GTP cyclohydrolase II
MMIAVVSCLLSACVNPWPENSNSHLARVIQKNIGHSSIRFHGNYCGYGRANGDFSAKSIDRLDDACRLHDICYTTTSDHCKCNGELRTAARALVEDKTLSVRLREKARLIETSVSVGICKIFPNGVLPRT